MSNAERRELPTNRRDIDKIVAWSVLRAARKLDRLLGAELAPYGLTPVQFGVLAQLAVEPLLTQSELARRIDVRPQSMNHLLDVMTDRGLVERTQAGGSGRPNPVRITDAGTQLLAQAWPVIRRLNSAAGLALPAADVRELNRIALLVLDS